MGTKNNPGQFDCYANALPDEPMFVLLARDPSFFRMLRKWANDRLLDIECGERPESDREMVQEALNCAHAGQRWRCENMGRWRKSEPGTVPQPELETAVNKAREWLLSFDPSCSCEPQPDGHQWICMEDRTPFDLTRLVEVVLGDVTHEKEE